MRGGWGTQPHGHGVLNTEGGRVKHSLLHCDEDVSLLIPCERVARVDCNCVLKHLERVKGFVVGVQRHAKEAVQWRRARVDGQCLWGGGEAGRRWEIRGAKGDEQESLIVRACAKPGGGQGGALGIERS
eukprot:scaffold26051_cov82-Isochrysis_galbana.AAC.1